MKQQPLATWNPARGVWETDTLGLCGHSELFSDSWPISGMTRAGRAFARPMWAHLTDASESSSSPGLLLKTPTSQLALNGSQHPDKRKAGGHGSTLTDEVEHLLPTPVVTDAKGARNSTAARGPDSSSD